MLAASNYGLHLTSSSLATPAILEMARRSGVIPDRNDAVLIDQHS